MSQRIECVALTCFTSEFSTWATILGYSRIRLHRAETLEEADFCLTATGATVLLTDVTFLDGTWRDALCMAADKHPLAAALVVADAVDGSVLADAYTRGACGVLWKPIDFITTIDWIRSVNQAARDRADVAGRAPLPARRFPASGTLPGTIYRLADSARGAANPAKATKPTFGFGVCPQPLLARNSPKT